MRLPAFLNFLRPVFKAQQLELDDPFRLVGHLKVERWKGGRLLDTPYDGKNYILNVGLTGIRDIIIGPGGSGFYGAIFRMAIGDGGVLPGEYFNPKQPDSTWPARTALFHEVLRQDVSVFSKPTAYSARFVANFDSTIVDPTSYSLVDHVINEAALIIGDGVLTVGGDPKQINKVPPDTADPDEMLFSTRTFRSTPFDPSEPVTLTLTWTITVARG
jgi:hypothetical protein